MVDALGEDVAAFVRPVDVRQGQLTLAVPDPVLLSELKNHFYQAMLGQLVAHGTAITKIRFELSDGNDSDLHDTCVLTQTYPPATRSSIRSIATGMSSPSPCALTNATLLSPGFGGVFESLVPESKALTLSFSQDHCLTSAGAVMSTDHGTTWTTVAAGDGNTLPVGVVDADEIWLAMAMPYTDRDWDRFAEHIAGNPLVRLTPGSTPARPPSP